MDMQDQKTDAWQQQDIFERIKKSPFRSRFRLRPAEKKYVAEKGMETIQKHARDIIQKRLSPANPANDGRQTPMKNHPVFIAQHATACCCRECLQKWHGIPKGRELSEKEQEKIVRILMEWIRRQMIS